MTFPKWATPERRQVLAQIAAKSGGACTLGYKSPEALYPNLFMSGFFRLKIGDVVFEDGDQTKAVCFCCPHHYNNDIDMLVREWKEDDRAELLEKQRLELEQLHHTPDLKGWGRRFDPVTREQFLANRPSYYLEGLGVSGLTFSRVAKIRIPGAYTRLHVDLPKMKLGRNKRKKLRRAQIHNDNELADSLCQSAVDDYWQKLGK